MSDEAVAVFTARSPARILKEGGSQAWTLDPTRARKCRYVVCVQNQHNADRDFSDASEPHGSVFLVGKVSDVVPSPEPDNGDRWLIRIGEYATLRVLDAWKGWRNPVRYTTLEGLGVDPGSLDFKPMPSDQERGPKPSQDRGAVAVVPLSFEDARESLAAYYRVRPEAVEIAIRG